MTDLPAPDAAVRLPRKRLRRVLLWSALVALLVVAQSLLVFLTVNHERVRAQEQVDAAATGAAADVRQALARQPQSLQALLWSAPPPLQWRSEVGVLLQARGELLRVERRDPQMLLQDAVDSPYQAPVFTRIARGAIELEAQLACAAAGRLAGPAYSRSYFVPVESGLGIEVMDLCVPLPADGRAGGFMVATVALGRLLEEAIGPELARSHELSFVEGDGTRLARAGGRRGAGVYVAERIIDLPGQSLQLRLDSGCRSR
jgi:two-component system sensor histidine kinase DctS